MTSEEWYEDNNCDHAHCPYGCDHPQPFMVEDDLVCGRCAIIDGEKSIMVPCTPKVCS